MTNFTPLGPLTTAGTPIESTIVVLGAPVLVAVVLLVAIGLATAVCVALLRARRRSAPRGATRPEVAMPYASAGRAR